MDIARTVGCLLFVLRVTHDNVFIREKLGLTG